MLSVKHKFMIWLIGGTLSVVALSRLAWGTQSGESLLESISRELKQRSIAGQLYSEGFGGAPKWINPDYQKDSTLDLFKRLVEIKAIYGSDDNMEISQSPGNVRRVGGAVFAIVTAQQMVQSANGWRLVTKAFGSVKELCPGERFRTQQVASFCTGFLIKSDLLITAAHCIPTDGDLGGVRFVQNFEMVNGREKTNFSRSEVFSGVRIVARDQGVGDWVLVKLGQSVDNVGPLTYRSEGKILDSDSVYVVGHPSGLPKKYAPNAKVRDNSPQSYFVSNLDTYGGSSGSPVLAQGNNVVEGLVVRGEVDFLYVRERNCFKSNVCPDSGCSGQHVTRITEISRILPPS